MDEAAQGDQQELLSWLQSWYASQCDGDWEHGYGVRIETLDNPGWLVDIDLTDSELVERAFEDYQFEATATDWVVCRVREQIFKGRGGPHNLVTILAIFRRWSEGDR